MSEKTCVPGIVVLGDINVDVLARLDTVPSPGGDFLTPELQLHCGGVGANTALALAKWGVPVRLLGSAGRDWFGDFALGSLERAGVDISFVQRISHPVTGLMFIAVSPDGQRTIFGSRGANAVMDVSTAQGSWLDGVRALHLMGYNFLSPPVAEVANKLLGLARDRSAWVSLDVGMAPSNQIRPTILELTKKVDVLFTSADEVASLTGEADCRKALAALERSGARQVVVKLGARGCLLREQGTLREVPAFSVPAVDTTGSGDAFTATFLRARLHDWPDAQAALLANAAGAAAASVVGGGEHMPDPDQIVGILESSSLASEWEHARVQVCQRLRQEFPRKAPVDS